MTKNIILDVNQLSDACYLEPDVGPCMAAIPAYYFDINTNSCSIFIWGGCGGVVPFESLQDCINSCE